MLVIFPLHKIRQDNSIIKAGSPFFIVCYINITHSKVKYENICVKHLVFFFFLMEKKITYFKCVPRACWICRIEHLRLSRIPTYTSLYNNMYLHIYIRRNVPYNNIIYKSCYDYDRPSVVHEGLNYVYNTEKCMCVCVCVVKFLKRK